MNVWSKGSREKTHQHKLLTLNPFSSCWICADCLKIHWKITCELLSSCQITSWRFFFFCMDCALNIYELLNPALTILGWKLQFFADGYFNLQFQLWRIKFLTFLNPSTEIEFKQLVVNTDGVLHLLTFSLNQLNLKLVISWRWHFLP